MGFDGRQYKKKKRGKSAGGIARVLTDRERASTSTIRGSLTRRRILGAAAIWTQLAHRARIKEWKGPPGHSRDAPCGQQGRSQAQHRALARVALEVLEASWACPAVFRDSLVQDKHQAASHHQNQPSRRDWDLGSGPRARDLVLFVSLRWGCDNELLRRPGCREMKRCLEGEFRGSVVGGKPSGCRIQSDGPGSRARR